MVGLVLVLCQQRPAFLAGVQAEVHDDSVEPGCEPGAGHVVRGGAPDSQERFLGDVFGQRGVSEGPHGDVQNAALMAADEVVVPMVVDGFSVWGVSDMAAQIDSMRAANPAIRVAGVLICQWRNSEVVRQGEALLRSLSLPVFTSVTPTRVRLAA